MQESPLSQAWWIALIIGATVTALVTIAVQRAFDDGAPPMPKPNSLEAPRGTVPGTQRSYGNGSPNISNVGRDVEIIINK